MISSRKVEDLLPIVQGKTRLWLGACADADIDVLIYCTHRDAEAQNALYAIGRTQPGKRVTNARGGDSFHQYRVAWDAVPLVHGKPAWRDEAKYLLMGEIAESLGIEWAGRWQSFKETAHFQFTGGLSLADFKAGKTIPEGV